MVERRDESNPVKARFAELKVRRRWNGHVAGQYVGCPDESVTPQVARTDEAARIRAIAQMRPRSGLRTGARCYS